MSSEAIGTVVRRRIDAVLTRRGWTQEQLGAALASPIKEAAVSRRLRRIEEAPDRCLGSIAEIADALAVAPSDLYPERFAAHRRGRKNLTSA